MMKFYTIGISIFCLICCTQTNNAKKTDNEIKEGLNVGNRAPELAYLDPQGNSISLSSLRGKLVLIDFWASWCPPCRKENPAVVAAYVHYKDLQFQKGNGFTIYSVSCDKEKAPWIKAIEIDQLSWPYHVSDLKGWESEATYIYKIGSIPANFLIDSEGIILAKDLRGVQLLQTLESLLKK